MFSALRVFNIITVTVYLSSNIASGTDRGSTSKEPKSGQSSSGRSTGFLNPSAEPYRPSTRARPNRPTTGVFIPKPTELFSRPYNPGSSSLSTFELPHLTPEEIEQRISECVSDVYNTFDQIRDYAERVRFAIVNLTTRKVTNVYGRAYYKFFIRFVDSEKILNPLQFCDTFPVDQKKCEKDVLEFDKIPRKAFLQAYFDYTLNESKDFKKKYMLHIHDNFGLYSDLVCPELYCGEIHDYTAEYEDGNNWTTV